MDTLVDRAIAFATKAHAGQFRKGPGQVPYIIHPLAVIKLLRFAGEVSDEVTLAAAALHDTIEDCGVSYETLVAEFGAEVADVVVEVTNAPGLNGREAKDAQIAKAPYMSQRAKLVKLADKAANVADLLEHPPGWKRESVLGYIDSSTKVVAAIGPVSRGLELAFKMAASAARFHYT